jgi:hypothetical protein
MKTIAQQLNIKEFPFIIRDKNGNKIYYENSYRWWYRVEYDSNGYQTYFENSDGYWIKYEFDSDQNPIYVIDSTELVYDKRPKPCENKVVEIDGIKYKLTAI